MPTYSGKVTLPGLHADVAVYRDAHAIPQIFAGNADDLFRAQGYVTAQERFWEMDFRRHLTAGRLAELFGPDEVETDTYLRTMGWRRVAEQEWQLIQPETRRYLQDYADGVNAYLRGRPTAAVSLEYSVLGLQTSGYRIAPWDPVDSLAWLKAMAWDLRGNMPAELNRALLLASGVSREQVESLYPAYSSTGHQPIVAGGSIVDGNFTAAPAAVPARAIVAAGGALSAVAASLARLPALGMGLPGVGSNSFVVSGKLTATGKPILANDPHLAPSMPGIWYQIGLHCSCPYNVEGFSFSGMPGVVIGHNARIAWGFTNLDPDVTDLYLEQIRGDQYLVDGVWRPLAVRRETITVAGGAPVTVTIRSTNNGPLLSDASADLRKAGGGYAVALRWTALDPGHTMDALFALDRAGDWTQFRAAAALFEVPAQNMVYADVDGNIGYQAPGRIPVRGKGDGRWPAPGWDSGYDWKGYLPFDALPNVENPPGGYLVTANQAVVDPKLYPYFLTDDWDYGYRSQRIADLIDAATSGGKRLSVAGAQRIQFDSRNGLAAQILVPYVLGANLPWGGASRPDPALDLLRGWDFQEPADAPAGSGAAKSSAAAAYFNAFWRHLLTLTFDELPPTTGADGLGPDGGDRWFAIVQGLLAQPDSQWWDRRSTPTVEHRDDIIVLALAAASDELTRTQGRNPQDWRWGRMHTLYVQNQSLGTSDIGFVRWLFNYGPVGVDGGGALVNATGWDASSGGYTVDAVPSMRMVVDLSNLDGSTWVQLTGESGHAFSDHYHDQFDLWRTGGTLPMPWSQPAIHGAAVATLTLRP
ncbi:MAG: penicillin acylase family protein [Micromonosporaceae bacterium]|nr:penicillin acylase family protein [Micromonosporaceae bacterium]